jgi:peptide/nickel transport system substrate-binding protein
VGRLVKDTSRRRLVVAAGVVLLAVGVVWGMASALADSSSPAPTGDKIILRLGTVNEPDSLNPFVGYEGSCYEIWSLNYDFVIGYGAADGGAVPAIAESWSVSPDGLTWTMKVRQGAKWQDGVPITAKDVAFTYNYIVDKKLSAYNSYTKLIEKAVAIDDTTCEITCSKPKANMERIWIYCFPEHIWGKIDDPEKYKMTYPIIGSGPFQTQEWKKGNYIRLTKNPNYWGGAPTIDEVIFQTYTNSDTMAQELKAGTLDGAYSVPPAQYKQISAMDGFTGYEFNLYYWDYLCFNCYDSPNSLGNPVLKDVKFRQALNWAVDKQKLCDIAWNGYAEPATTIMPPDEWPAGFDAHYEPTAEEKFGFDIAKANQLLDEAGYKDTDGNGIREYKGKDIKLRLESRAESTESQKEGKLVADWFTQCGLSIDYSVIDDGALSDRLYHYDANTCAYAPDYDMYFWDYAGYADPGDTLASFTTDQIEWWNDPCWSNAEYDKLCEEQFSQVVKSERLDTIHRMQQIFYTESPQMALTYPKSLEVVNSAKWEGWTPYNGGGVFMTNYNVDSYLKLKPKAESSSSSSSSTTTWIIVGVVAAVVVIVLIVVFTRRGRKAVVEE